MNPESPEAATHFMQSALAASDDCIEILSLDGRLSFMSDGGQRLMEVDEFETIRGRSWPDFWQGAATGEARNAIEIARNGRSARFQAAAETMRGNMRWLDVKVSGILDADGRVVGILSVSRDITDLKAAAAADARRSSVEMAHRLKNILALVQAIAAQTLAGKTEEAVLGKFFDRIASLSKAHDVLLTGKVRSGWIRDVVDAAAPPGSLGTRIAVDGPNIRISAPAVVTLSMLLHELSTNAVKHGAWSNEVGRVALSWKVDSATADSSFVLAWVESGGPAVTKPERAGLGARLIGAGFMGKGNSEIRYDTDGFKALFRARMDEIEP